MLRRANLHSATLVLTTELCYKATMNRAVWRFLLTCLLLVALPLKGLAATSMLACGPNHHQKYGAVVHDGSATGSSWHDHGNGVSDHHSDEQPLESDTTHSSLSSDDAPSAAQTPHLNTKFKCNSCAPCCVSAALTSDLSIHIAAPASSADFPAFPGFHPSAPVGRLDRPPRITLA